MAGHSKWKQIKYKKAIADSKRSKQFTKLIKEITVAAKTGGGDPNGNARLRFLLDKSKEINMPQDNATRAIKKGTGELPGVHYESITYEGYGPGGIAVIIEVLTDNRNRAIADVRNVFSRQGGTVTEPGAVNWMFHRAGVIRMSGSTSEDELLELLIDHNIQEIEKVDGGFLITCDPKSLEDIKHILQNKKFDINEAELEWVPQQKVKLSGAAEEKAIEFLQTVEELEDVQNVFSNLE